MFYFTADEHHGHKNIIAYCNRPFTYITVMDDEIISRHNEVVRKDDTTVHAGDFTLIKNRKRVEQEYVAKLNGNHIFLRGSHDYWLRKDKNISSIWEKTIGGKHIVVCHYCMRTWARSHYNSWHLFGHSHGKLDPIGKSWDIGVDNNRFYPLSFKEICDIMNKRPDNPNLVKK